MNLINMVYWLITSFLFIIYWVMLPNWIKSGDIELYGLIGSGIAANGAFIGNIIWTIITKNEEYKFNHNGEDMPFVKKIKNCFVIIK